MYKYLTDTLSGKRNIFDSFMRGMSYLIPGANIPLEPMTAEEARRFDAEAIRSDWAAVFDMGQSDIFDCLFD